MRMIIVTLAVVVGVIVIMNFSQVGSALADEVACMACKAQGSSMVGGKTTSASKQQCMRDFIANRCAEHCRQKSGKDD